MLDDLLKGDVYEKPELMSVLTLAFLGDAIHSLFVKRWLISQKDFKQKDLQSKTAQLVCAGNQARVLDKKIDDCNEIEKDIVRRARNTKTNNIAKNSDAVTYKKSTAFEALVGFFYLKGLNDRLKEFLEASLENDF